MSHDSDSQAAVGASLDELIDVVRSMVRDALAGNDTAGKDTEAVLALLVGYAWGIERILTAASGGELLPGHAVSVTGYVQQALSGQGRQHSAERLQTYFNGAIRLLNRTHAGVEKQVDHFAESLAEALHPSKIEKSVSQGLLGRIFGSQSAYWNEYKLRMKNLDGKGVRRIVEDQRKRHTKRGKGEDDRSEE